MHGVQIRNNVTKADLLILDVSDAEALVAAIDDQAHRQQVVVTATHPRHLPSATQT